jgi:lipoprotein signal peptidase
VLGSWFRFTLVYNPGAAFGLHLGPQSRWIFSALTIVALVILARLYATTRAGDTARVSALALVCAGAIGNLIDRLRSFFGVVDFIDIGIGDARWPTFNIADMAVSIGAGLLAYLLTDSIVDDYMPLLDVLSDRMDDLEDQIFGEFQPESIQEIFRIKKQLLFLRRTVTPLRDVFNTMLRREQPIFPRETHVYFQDVFDHIIRVADTIDTLRDMLSSTMDAYLSIQGNRMNQIMKRLTSISTVLMSATLVAGIYGMNFDYMPELHWRFGYVGALAAMLAVGLVLYFYLRKVKWL